MTYQVGRPYILALWIYEPYTHFKVHYWSQASWGDFVSDSEWIVPGTIC